MVAYVYFNIDSVREQQRVAVKQTMDKQNSDVKSVMEKQRLDIEAAQKKQADAIRKIKEGNK